MRVKESDTIEDMDINERDEETEKRIRSNCWDDKVDAKRKKEEEIFLIKEK